MYGRYMQKRCCGANNTWLISGNKYIIIYNVSIDYKYLNINRLARDTPKSQGIKNHIHSSSEFFIFYFSFYDLLTCLHLA